MLIKNDNVMFARKKKYFRISARICYNSERLSNERCGTTCLEDNRINLDSVENNFIRGSTEAVVRSCSHVNSQIPMSETYYCKVT